MFSFLVPFLFPFITWFHSISVSVSMSGFKLYEITFGQNIIKITLYGWDTNLLFISSLNLQHTFAFPFVVPFLFPFVIRFPFVSVSVSALNFMISMLVRTWTTLHCLAQIKICDSYDLSIYYTTFCFCFCCHFRFRLSCHSILFQFPCQP